MYAVLLGLVAGFFLTYFNRFSGLRSGNGEYTAGVAFLAGFMPYRDYFTTAPPLNLLKSAMLLKVFGTALIVTRCAGVMERLLIAAVLFRWLRQIFRPGTALVASLVTLILSAGDRTDPIASYNHDAILWAMLSGLAASLVLDEKGRDGSRFLLSMASGACAGLSILTKQTVGLGSACTILAVMALLIVERRGVRSAGMWAAAFVPGCGVPLAAVALVLARMHLLPAFVQMLFVKGPAAKAAHLSDFAVRELRVGWDDFGWLTLGSFLLFLGWRAMLRSAERESLREAEPELHGAGDDGVVAANGELRFAGWVLAAGVSLLVAAELLRRLPALHDLSKSAVYFTFMGLSLLLVRYAIDRGFGSGEPSQGLSQQASEEASQERSPEPSPKPSQRAGYGTGQGTGRSQILLLGAVSWSITFTLSLSWPAFEAMLLPGLGLLVALVLEGARSRWRPLVYAALSFAVLMQMREKLDLPFGFDYQDEAGVGAATSSSVEPQMRGLRLPRETVRFIDETTATIRSNTRADEPIFVYPEMGLLYALSGRTYPTVSGSHNIDVLNDRFAAEEVDRLRAARPAVIVFYRETEEQQRSAERLWRRGQPSGQRLLVSAIEELVSGYRLTGTYRLREGDPPILVYVRARAP